MGIENSTEANLEGAVIALLVAQSYPLTRCSDYRGQSDQTGSSCTVWQEICEVFANMGLTPISFQPCGTGPILRKSIPAKDLLISLQAVLVEFAALGGTTS